LGELGLSKGSWHLSNDFSGLSNGFLGFSERKNGLARKQKQNVKHGLPTLMFWL
jgi:hypothetical protein